MAAEAALFAEMELNLVYDKNATAGRGKGNNSNGSSSNTLIFQYSELLIQSSGLLIV